MCVPLVVTGILFELFLAGGARDAHWTGTNEDASVASVKSIRDAGLMYLLANCSISMFCSTCLVLTSPSLSFGDRDFRTFSFGDWWSFPLTHLDFLSFSLRLACGTAVSSVRISISVSGFTPAQDEPEECLPWTRRTGVCPLFPLPGNVGVRSGQQEAYAKVICQDLLKY